MTAPSTPAGEGAGAAPRFKTMWFSLSLCDADGQIKNGFALELRSASLHCLIQRDMLFDLIHADGELERIRFKAVPGRASITEFFRLGLLAEYVTSFQMRAEYPATSPVTKEEFRRRCGTGLLLNAPGYFTHLTNPQGPAPAAKEGADDAAR